MSFKITGTAPVETDKDNLDDKLSELEDKVSDLESDKEHLSGDNKVFNFIPSFLVHCKKGAGNFLMFLVNPRIGPLSKWGLSYVVRSFTLQYW